MLICDNSMLTKIKRLKFAPKNTSVRDVFEVGGQRIPDAGSRPPVRQRRRRVHLVLSLVHFAGLGCLRPHRARMPWLSGDSVDRNSR